MKRGVFGNIGELAREIGRRADARKDFIADTGAMKLQSDENGSVLHAHLNGVDIGGEVKELALLQMAQRAGVPTAYFRRMATEAPALLDQNMNHWLDDNHVPRMIRTLDGSVDAFLSNSYKRMDNAPIAEQVLPVLAESGVKVESCDVTDTKMFIKCVSPKLEGEIRRGDAVQMGLVLSNSEVGLGFLSLKPMIYRLVCENGMITGSEFGGGIKRAHRGSKQDIGIVYADDTARANAVAIGLQVRDTVKQLLSPETFQKHLMSMQQTALREINGDVPAAVEQLSKVVSITQDEEVSILDHLIRGGDFTQWGMLNAVTRYSQDVDSYDRATELEAIGGKILELNPKQWNVIAEAEAA